MNPVTLPQPPHRVFHCSFPCAVPPCVCGAHTPSIYSSSVLSIDRCFDGATSKLAAIHRRIRIFLRPTGRPPCAEKRLMRLSKWAPMKRDLDTLGCLICAQRIWAPFSALLCLLCRVMWLTVCQVAVYVASQLFTRPRQQTQVAASGVWWPCCGVGAGLHWLL